MSPSVSILLCTRNRAASLEPTLESLLAVERPAGWEIECVIVDNGSSDATPRVVEAFAQRAPFPVRSLVAPQPGKSRALNAGVAVIKSSVVLFTDDDVRFPANWIRAMCNPIISGASEIVQGGIRWAPNLLADCRNPLHGYLPRMITSTRHKNAEEMQHALIGANMALARLILPQDPFDPELGPGALGLGEETLLGWQLQAKGCRRTLALETEVEHHFDAGRLASQGILGIARSKGRALGFLQHHWYLRPEKRLRLKMLKVSLKNMLRTVINPAAWPGKDTVPEWKYSYHSELARLAQLATESRRPPKYREFSHARNLR